MTDPGETKKIRLRMSREHEVTESGAETRMREKLTLIDDLAIVLKRVVRDGRELTTSEAMHAAQVLGHCFPRLHSEATFFAAFVNALPVPLDKRAHPIPPSGPSEF